MRLRSAGEVILVPAAGTGPIFAGGRRGLSPQLAEEPVRQIRLPSGEVGAMPGRYNLRLREPLKDYIALTF